MEAPNAQNLLPTKPATASIVPKKLLNWRKKLKKYWWLALIAVIVIFIIIGIFSPKKSTVEYSTDTVQRGDLVQTVEVTGSVKAAKAIDLHFPATGTLQANNVKVGAEVKMGDVLVTMNDRELKLRRDQAAANLAQASANLQKILAGASIEDINISEKSVASAKTEYDNAQKNLTVVKLQVENDLASALKSVDKAQADLTSARQSLLDTTANQDQTVKNLEQSALTTLSITLADAQISLDKIQTIYNNSEAVLNLGNNNPPLKSYERQSNEQAKVALASATIALTRAQNSSLPPDIDNALLIGATAINHTYNDLNYMYSVLSSSTLDYGFTSTELESYKTVISASSATVAQNISALQTAKQSVESGRLTRVSTLNTATNAITTAEKAVAIAESNYQTVISSKDSKTTNAENQVATMKASYDLAIAQLNYKKSPARSFDVNAYRSQVAQLAAAYEIAKKNYDDAQIKAPVDGIITAVNYEVGEAVNATQPAVSLVTKNNYEVVVDISESDISKVRVEAPATFTLDAYGEDVTFTGKVTHVDPAQTVIQDVIYYQVTLAFDENGQEIKPGMTANIIIHPADRQNVLFIPRRAVIEKDGKKIVRLLINNAPQEVEVTTGLRGDNGLIEVTDGLDQGEIIITFIKELK